MKNIVVKNKDLLSAYNIIKLTWIDAIIENKKIEIRIKRILTCVTSVLSISQQSKEYQKVKLMITVWIDWSIGSSFKIQILFQSLCTEISINQY